MNGIVKNKVAEKGFGFITPDDGGKDFFFHSTSVEGTTFDDLAEGTAVTFDVEDSPKGPRAVGVRVA